jgi:arsenite methyltransferase
MQLQTLSAPAQTTTTKTDAACCGPGCCGEDAPGAASVTPGPEARSSAPATTPDQASTPTANPEALVEAVRERYSEIARTGTSCCGPSGCSTTPLPEDVARGLGYSASELAELPPDANLGLGCGAPLGFLAPRPGETVLDLGSGPGIDVLLAARAVGPQGRVIGVDMTPAMLARARANAAAAGVHHVEFREGRLEQLPVVDASVDAVTSNCVINLVPDKAAVFHEVARVLRPGGRMVISDIVLDAPLPPSVAGAVEAYVGCIAGASRRDEYLALLTRAGFTDVEVLREIDYAATLLEIAPGEIEGLLAGSGLAPRDVLGIVKSVTVRARKPA